MRRLLLVVMLASLLLGRVAAAQDRFPGAAWDHLPPAQSGWSEALLADVRAWSEQIHSTAFMVVHRGVVVAEWGDTAKRTELASVRKSLLSALIGIAVAERKISLDSTLAQLGIDDNAPALTDLEKQATVRMLLEARSGVYHPALYETPGMAKQRPARGSHEPGTFWYYNNWDFNALGTIYEHATGTGIYDALDRLIAQPIGMQDYRPQDGVYFPGAASDHRAYPLRMSARDSPCCI
jgi:CubicO group peptidase (beta-lactamase class C family)